MEIVDSGIHHRLRTVRVSCSSLKSLSFLFFPTPDTVIQVLEAKNLESITYDGAEIPNQKYIFKFNDCIKVKEPIDTRSIPACDGKCLEDLEHSVDAAAQSVLRI
ncbi:hypothetical protein TIFTF001_015720 [Ficus carica]|uniref:Uncharacterized protein n=1 Tax=Ficus carica TaxID=3494 RepID=A0AA87ZZ60_FICCA|nr:hypothetical protein TIFTF001_015720 [Ficus carica]